MPEVLPFVRPVDAALVGRTTERAALASFVARAVADGAVLLVTGEPGVGKTELLESAARDASAAGAALLRAEGVESEAEVAHAGLHQLLLPLLDELDGLPRPHQEALAVACRVRTAVRLDSHVIPHCASQKNVIPAADMKGGDSNIRIVFLDGPLLPIRVIVGMR